MTESGRQPGVSTTWTFGASWRSFSAVQGGLVLGRLLRATRGAMTDRRGRPAVVRSAAAHFLSAVVPDVELRGEIRPDRLGSMSSVRAQAWQGEQLRVVAQVLLTAPGAVDRPSTPLPGLDLPTGFVTPAGAEPLELPMDFVPFTRHLEFRAVGLGRPLAGGPEPRLTAWIRPRESADLAGPLVQLGVLADALPPSLYAVTTAPAMLPTVEMTLHLVRSVPPVGSWLRVEQWTSWQDAEICIDDATLHDEAGLLVARSRQTRRMPRR